MNLSGLLRSQVFMPIKVASFFHPFILLAGLVGAGFFTTSTLHAEEYLLDRASLGYQVQYLDDWDIQIGEPGDGIDAYFSHTSPEIEVNIAVVQAPPNVETVEKDLVTMVADETQKLYKEVMGFTSEVATWKEKPAAYYTFSGLLTGDREEDIRSYNKQYIVLHAGRFYVITIVTAESDLEKAREVWKVFLDHLKFV